MSSAAVEYGKMNVSQPYTLARSVSSPFLNSPVYDTVIFIAMVKPQIFYSPGFPFTPKEVCE